MKSTEIEPSEMTADPNFLANREKVKKALPALLIIYLLSYLMLQAFNLVYQNIGNILGVSSGASLLSTIPAIVLAVLSLVYDTICDYVSPRQMTIGAVIVLIIGSLIGFFNFNQFSLVMLARILQVIGGQMMGSVYLVMTIKYLFPQERAFYIGIFAAVYNIAVALGILAGGLIETIPWQSIFLIPVLAVFLLPTLIKNMPNISGQARRLDWIGLILFTIFVTLISVILKYPSWWLGGALFTSAVILALWIGLYKNPFMDRKMITNKSFMSVLLIILIFDFFTYACIPIYQVIGRHVYHISLAEVSYFLAAVYLLTAVVSIFTGKIVHALGRYKTIFWASLLVVVGFALSAIFINSGFWLLTIFACIYNFGVILAYSPLYDAGTAVLPQEARGRGLGICQLTLNTSAAIGITTYSALLTTPAINEKGWLGIGLHTISQIRTSNMFWVMALVALVAFILVIVFRKLIYDFIRKVAQK